MGLISTCIFCLIVSASHVHSEDKTKVKFANSLHNFLALGAFKMRTYVSTVVSPLAVRLPLCKLASIADDEAKLQLMTVLGIRDGNKIVKSYAEVKEILSFYKETDLMFTNKIYVDSSYDLDPRFVKNSTDEYGVQVEKIDFGNPETATDLINNWIDSVTLRRVRDVLYPGDIDKNTAMVVVNGLHFKGTWSEPFAVNRTKLSKFRHFNNTLSRVPMMKKFGQYQYYNDIINDFQMVTLLLEGGRMSVTFVVPNSHHGLPHLLVQLDSEPDLIKKGRERMKYTVISVKLPRFKIKSTLDLNRPLKYIGLKKIFNSTDSGLKSILNGATQGETRNIHLSKLKQKVFIEFDEYGSSRRDRYRHSFDDYDADSGERRREIHGDRPFLFTVSLHIADNDVLKASNAKFDIFSGLYFGPE